MSFKWAALMPHPPVIVPEVGKGREQSATNTLIGLERLRLRLSAAMDRGAPDALLVLSPHQPFISGKLFINSAEHIRGSLARFGVPTASLRSDLPGEALRELADLLAPAEIPTVYGKMDDISPDHGSIVPLLLIRDSFPDKTLPPLILASPSGLTPAQALRLGQALRGLRGDRRWALLSSGDLSHRLKDDGPYGFNPDGPVFDKTVVQALQEGRPDDLLDLPPERCENAGECGLRSVLTLLGLAQTPLEVLSYEGPFGVGYCNAFWDGEKAPAKRDDASDAAAGKKPVITVSVKGPVKTEGAKNSGAVVAASHPYPRLARQSVTAHLQGRPAPTRADATALSPGRDIWSERHGCFVSIKNKDGSLRGCIGTFMPTKSALDEEIAANAVLAASKDHRFPPMRAEELEKVRFSVDVLSTPELLREGMELDPKKYGVIVTKNGRRGLLLPDLEGVTEVHMQLAIAAQKGGIADLDGAEIYRFTVDRYPEEKD